MDITPLITHLINFFSIVHSEGWYCSGGATSPMPSNPAEGGRCQPGTFCPGGSDAPTNCTEGMYCATAGLASPTANCTQGTIYSLFGIGFKVAFRFLQRVGIRTHIGVHVFNILS